MLNVLHIICLAAPFDNSDVSNVEYSFEHNFSVWANLEFASHYAIVVTFIWAKIV